MAYNWELHLYLHFNLKILEMCYLEYYWASLLRCGLDLKWSDIGDPADASRTAKNILEGGGGGGGRYLLYPYLWRSYHI